MSEQLDQARWNHLHNPELEGALPEGFGPWGNKGTVRIGYPHEEGEQICIVNTDRIAAFEVVSPTPIPGKGRVLNEIAARELEIAAKNDIPTWYGYVPEENPNATVGTLASTPQIELVFRNYPIGGVWTEYQQTGGFEGFALPPDLSRWHDFTDNPLFTPSVKKRTGDVNFNPDNPEIMARVSAETGITREMLDEMEALGRKLFALGTEIARKRGLVMVNSKYEMGHDQSGNLMLIDELHTPDTTRYVLAKGFNEKIERGEDPEIMSGREIFRSQIRAMAAENGVTVQEQTAQPLPKPVAQLIASYYYDYYQRVTGHQPDFLEF